MSKYEYKVLGAPTKHENSYTGMDLDAWEKKLNKLGHQGWKIVGTGGSGSGSEYFHSENGWVILMREK